MSHTRLPAEAVSLAVFFNALRLLRTCFETKTAGEFVRAGREGR